MKNAKGFGAIEGLLVLIIVGVIGFAGWYAYHAKNTSDSTANTTKTQADTTPSTNQYLPIKEWGVTLNLSTVISDANYQITTEKKISNTEVPVAKLSTTKLDTACGTGALASGSFDSIAQYSPSDKVIVSTDPTRTTTAEQAAKEVPDYFKQLGDHVYYFSSSNSGGLGCKVYSDNNFSLAKAIHSAFKSLDNQ